MALVFFLICSYFLTTSMVQSVHDVCMCVYVESAFLFQFVLKMSTGFNKMLSIFFSLYFECSLLVKREPITTKNPQSTFLQWRHCERKKHFHWLTFMLQRFFVDPSSTSGFLNKCFNSCFLRKVVLGFFFISLSCQTSVNYG